MKLKPLSTKLLKYFEESQTWQKVFKLLKPIAPQVGIVMILIAYVFMGAAFFLRFGKPIEWESRIEAQKIVTDKLYVFEETVLNYTHFALMNGTVNGTEEELRQHLKIEIQQLYNLLVVHAKSIGTNKDLFGSFMDKEWTLETAGLFSFSLITTIGSGILTPSTPAGRIFGLFYGLLGIPLAMMTIANTGKFLGEFLAAIYILAKSEIRKIKCRPHWRRPSATATQATAESFSSRDQLMSECESQTASGAEPKKADIDTLGESDQKTVTLQLMLGAFFTYMILGAALMPQFKSSDFLSSMFLCFVSITTVGMAESGSIWSTICYLTLGLALTTVAIEVAGDYLQRLHHMARKLTNAKAVMVSFGGKKLTMGELVWAIGQQYGIDESQILDFAGNLDSFVENAIEEKKAGTLLTVKPRETLAYSPKAGSEILFADDYEF